MIKGYPVDTMVELNKRRRNGQYPLEDSFVPGIPFTLFNESSVKTKVGVGTVYVSLIPHTYTSVFVRDSS